MLVKNEALHAINNLKKWMQPQHVERNLVRPFCWVKTHFLSKTIFIILLGLFTTCTTFFSREHSISPEQRPVLCWAHQSRLKPKLLWPFCKSKVGGCLFLSVHWNSASFCFHLMSSLCDWFSSPRWTSVWWSVSRWGWCSSWGPGAVRSRCVWCRWSGPSQQVQFLKSVFLHTSRRSDWFSPSICAGNCAVISPSECTTHTSELLHRLFPFYLDNVSKFDWAVRMGSPGYSKVFMSIRVPFVFSNITLSLESVLGR